MQLLQNAFNLKGNANNYSVWRFNLNSKSGQEHPWGIQVRNLSSGGVWVFSMFLKLKRTFSSPLLQISMCLDSLQRWFWERSVHEPNSGPGKWPLCLMLCNPSSVQLLSHVQLFATPWTIAHHISLSVTNSWSLLKLMSIESVMPSNHLVLWHPLLLLP